MAAPLSVILDARRSDLDRDAVRVGRVIAAFAEASAAGLVRDMAILSPRGPLADAFATLAEAIGASEVQGRPAAAAAALSAEWALVWRADVAPPIGWESRVTGVIDRGRNLGRIDAPALAARLGAQARRALDPAHLAHGQVRRREPWMAAARQSRGHAADRSPSLSRAGVSSPWPAE